MYAFELFNVRSQPSLNLEDVINFVDVMMTERENMFQILNDRADHCLIIRTMVDGLAWAVFILAGVAILFSFTVLITVWGTLVGLSFVFGEFFLLLFSLSKLNMFNLFI